MNRLFKIGFECVGHWKLEEDRLSFVLDKWADKNNILYAFVTGDAIKYLGKTTMPLSKRLYGYQNPGPTQLTNIRNNANIRTILGNQQSVSILAFPDNGMLSYGGFHVNLAAGLEDSLIQGLKPPWNGGGVEVKIEEHKEKSEAPIKDSETSFSESLPEVNQSQPNSEERPLETKQKSLRPSYSFPLRPTYFNSGFFNVPMDFERYFGRDKEPIELYCEPKEQRIDGHINRSVNKTDAPRIMGGVELRQWFQENFRIDQLVGVEILSPNSIKLFKKVR